MLHKFPCIAKTTIVNGLPKIIHFMARFGIFRLLATITPQWLQITGNSQPHDPSMGCLVSILLLQSIQSRSPGLCTPYKKRPQIFLRRLQCTILPISRRPNFTKFEHNRWSMRQWRLSEQNFGNFTVRGNFFQKNDANNFPKRFKSNTVLWAFHTIQPSSFMCVFA